MDPMNHLMTRRALARRIARLGATATVTMVLGGCGVLPFAAPQPTRVARIGYLGPKVENTPGAASDFQTRAGSDEEKAFRQGLRERGWIEGQNLSILWRYVDDDLQRATAAAELVSLPVDLIMAPDPSDLAAAMRATSEIPILFELGVDPVQRGLVASLAHPGANLTGLAGMTDLNAKRVQLLKEVVPSLSRLGVLWDPAVNLEALRAVQSAAQALGVQVVPMPVSAAEDLEGAFANATAEGIDGLLDLPVHVTVAHRPQLLALARQNQLPDVFSLPEYAEDGGLMAFNFDQVGMVRRMSYFADRILRGARAGDLPVEQPTSFVLAVNQTTAQSLGLTIPPDVAAQVTEWIQ
jgi:putative tryptophan/tyrosine transport system substrate-binding protein